MTRKPQSPQKILFGWCTTGHHPLCRKQYETAQGVTRTCECACHEDPWSE